jgi:hypothetical protein
MIKPSEEVVRAIAQLSGSGAFDVFVTWIRESLVTGALQAAHASGEIAVKKAGGCLELEEILNHIAKTPEYISKFRESKQ